MFREMRRSKQNLSQETAEKILREGDVGVLALSGDDGYSYAVPINYAVEIAKNLRAQGLNIKPLVVADNNPPPVNLDFEIVNLKDAAQIVREAKLSTASEEHTETAFNFVAENLALPEIHVESKPVGESK